MQQERLKDSESRGDLEYIRKVNALIPLAVRNANKRMRRHKGMTSILKKSPHKDGGDYYHDLWTQYFFEEMDIARKVK